MISILSLSLEILSSNCPVVPVCCTGF
jgi:hypothetical protein